MAHGHMCCGLVKDKLMVRVNPDAYDQLLGEAGVQPMDFTGKPMRGFLYVTSAGTSTASDLRIWVKRALDFAESRAPKASGNTCLKLTPRPGRTSADEPFTKRSEERKETITNGSRLSARR